MMIRTLPGTISCRMSSLLWLSLFLSLLACTTAQSNSSSSCTLCFDGSDPNLDGTIGETSCATIATAIQQTPSTDSLCPATQLQGFLYCDCPSFPDAFCALCTIPAAGEPYVPIPPEYRDLMLPGTDGITCGAAEFAESCVDDGSSDAATFCGCAGSAPRNSDCGVCGTNATADDVQQAARLLPPLFTTSCASLDRELGISDGDATCMVDERTSDIPVDVPAYCACPNNTAANHTTACPTTGLCGNFSVRNPSATIGNATTTSITCQDLATAWTYITDASYCTELSSAYATLCCEEENTAPTPTAPTAPTPVMTGPTAANVPGAPTPTSNSKNETSAATNRGTEASTVLIAVSAGGWLVRHAIF